MSQGLDTFLFEPSNLTELCDRFSLSRPEIGMRLGFSFVAASFGALVGTPIVGALLGDDPADFKWWAASTFSAVVMLAGAALFVISRTLVVKRKGTQLV